MKVVLLSSDLMVVSRVEGAAAQAGAEIQATSNAAAAIEYCSDEQVGVLIVDLSMPALDPAAVVNQRKADASHSVRVVAFGPHVHENRLAAAREAGCDLVVSRGKFFAEIDSILKG
jgi:DNA-binding NarL/FixJ family response regulator